MERDTNNARASFDILALVSPSGATAFAPDGSPSRAPGLREALSALKPPRRARVLVAADGVFSQTVRLPAVQTAGLSPQELESALFYEVEPFCGLTREDAAIGHAPAAEGAWRVVVAGRADFSSMEAAVAGARCALSGVTAAPPPEAAAAGREAVLAALFPEGGPAAPVVRPPRKAFDAAALPRLGAAAAALVALLCAADWLYLRSEARRLEPERAACESMARVNDAIRADIAADNAAAGAIREARARRERAARDLVAMRDAWPALLDALAREAGDDFVLRSIAPADAGDGAEGRRAARVSAAASGPEAATAAMARLANALAPLGWALAPGPVSSGASGAVSPFSFTVVRAARGGER